MGTHSNLGRTQPSLPRGALSDTRELLAGECPLRHGRFAVPTGEGGLHTRSQTSVCDVETRVAPGKPVPWGSLWASVGTGQQAQQSTWCQVVGSKLCPRVACAVRVEVTEC